MSTPPVDPVDCPAHSRRAYVDAVLSAYRSWPGTTGHVRRPDRLLAGSLHDRGISLDAIRAAFVLATARRTFRPADAPPLQTIRSLHYFLPVINEIVRDNNMDAFYIHYLELKLNNLPDWPPRP
jgi:hypothetical protein